MPAILAINYIISATYSLPLRGLIIVGQQAILCVQVQNVGFNHRWATNYLMRTGAKCKFKSSLGNKLPYT